MPRLPVDGKKVIEYRVTLGAKERQLLDDAQTAYSFKNISTPIITAINDNTTLLLISGLLALLLPKWLPEDWEIITEDMTLPQVQDWLEIQNIAGAGGGALIGSVAGPVGAIIGAILGSYGVEIAEDVIDDTKRNTAITAGIMVLTTTLRRLGRSLQPDGSSSGGGGGGGF
jgi:hypothetical protein